MPQFSRHLLATAHLIWLLTVSQAHFFQPNHGTTDCVRCQSLAGEPRFLEVYLRMISKDKRFAVHPVACAATIYVPNS